MRLGPRARPRWSYVAVTADAEGRARGSMLPCAAPAGSTGVCVRECWMVLDVWWGD